MSNNNYDSGDFRFTPPIIPNTKLAGQRNVLTYQNAPRTTETAQTNGGPTDNEYHNLSYRRSLNGFTSGPYSADKINPLGFPITQRADENPYFLFMGKFSSNSQGIQNTDPVQVGHVDISGIQLNQQPSNIYNIPDVPKPYTLIQSNNASGFYPNDYYKSGSKNSNLKIIYDASSCPVNWRMFGPIQNQVLDWEENGGPGPIGEQGPTGEQGPPGNTSLKTGLYDTSNNGSFIFVQSPSKRDISGIYFDTNNFDISFNPNTNPNAYISIKGGTGTDLSFNNFFFKQPEMPMDCSCVFVTGTGGGNDMIKIKWDKPFNRKAGTSYNNNGVRYFYENNLQENWLPHFSELVLDISGGPNNRTFSKDSIGNFSHTSAFGLFSANNTKINIEANTNPGVGSISASGSNYGSSGVTTTIIDNFNPNSNSVNAGGTPNQNPLKSDLGIGNTYDIAIYYRNESKINTPPGLPVTDLKYNNHNICLFENIIFGIPGFVNSAQDIVYWGGGGESGRYYLGGVGPNTKDDKTKSNTGEGLNLGWNNISILKVGYDCSLNMTGYSPGLAIQAPQQIPGGKPNDLYGIANQSDISYNNFDVIYNLQSNGIPNTMSDTKKNWPNGTGTGGINNNTGVPSANNDYLKEISKLAGVPSSLARDHPEYIYTITEYNTTNDTLDKPPPIGTGRVRKEQFSGTLPIRNVIPIWSRADCNETNNTKYENPLVSVTEIPSTTSKSFLDLYSVRGPTNNQNNQVRTLYSSTINGINHEYRGRGRKPGLGFNDYTDVIYVQETLPVSGNPTAGSWLELDSDSRVFRQLANHGTPKTGIINPTGSAPTYNEMVNVDSFIGQVPSTFLSTPYTVSRVEFRADSGTPGNWTGAPFLTTNNKINIPSWPTGVVPSNLSTTSTTNTYPSNTKLEVSFSASAPFDIGQSDSETSYSSKRGYYLGFDISNVKVELDPWENKSASGVQGGNPFPDSVNISYNQYRVGIMHKMAERGSASIWLSNPPIKEFIFRLAKRNNNDIIGNPTHVVVDGYNSGVTFTDFFGVKRLPANQSGNKDNGVRGTGLELTVSFDLDFIDKNWIPHSGDTGIKDLVADVNYVIDPEQSQLSINNSEFTWANINNNEGITSVGQPTSGIVGNSSGNEVRFNSFVELHEGISLTGKEYSRAITEATSSPYFSAAAAISGGVSRSGRPLFGLYDDQIYHAHNVTYSDDHEIRKLVSNYSAAQKILLNTAEKNKFTWAQNELFWDYTWPKIPSGASFPGQYLPTGFSGCELLELPSFTTSSPWGGNLRELPVLDPSLTAVVPYNVSYNHSVTLKDYQSMWCNGSFVGSGGPGGTLINNNFNNPYTNYSLYHNQSQNYTSKLKTGSNVQGISIPSTDSPISGGFGSSSSYDKVKWILLKQTTVSNSNVTVNVKDKNGVDISLGDYLLFYCEYRNSASYGALGQVTLDAYSTWLNATSNNVPTYNAIVKIGTGTSSDGGNNGCFAGGTLTKPQILDLGTGTSQNKTKYFLFGLKPGTRISKITLT